MKDWQGSKVKFRPDSPPGIFSVEVMPKWYPIIGGPWDGDKFYPSSDPQPGEVLVTRDGGQYVWSDNGLSIVWRSFVANISLATWSAS